MPQFRPGQSGNPKGGSTRTRTLTVEVRALTRKLFDREYWTLKYEELHSGTCHPKIESTLLAYAFGVPVRDEPTATAAAVIQLGPLEALRELVERAESGTSLPDIQAVSAATPLPAGAAHTGPATAATPIGADHTDASNAATSPSLVATLLATERETETQAVVPVQNRVSEQTTR